MLLDTSQIPREWWQHLEPRAPDSREACPGDRAGTFQRALPSHLAARDPGQVLRLQAKQGLVEGGMRKVEEWGRAPAPALEGQPPHTADWPGLGQRRAMDADADDAHPGTSAYSFPQN